MTPAMRSPAGFDDMRRETLRHLAGLCAAAAMTAPKSGGQLVLRGAAPFIETLWLEDRARQGELSGWMQACGREPREAIWFRDADLCERVDGVLFIGLKDSYSHVYDCGACGYATCAELLDATTAQRKLAGHTLEFASPTCSLCDIDLGIAVGSAAKTASINNVDCRCQTRVAAAARRLKVIRADVPVALSLSLTHKAEDFDRRIPEVDFDAASDAEPPAPRLGPRAAATGGRIGGRHRQARTKGETP